MLCDLQDSGDKEVVLPNAWLAHELCEDSGEVASRSKRNKSARQYIRELNTMIDGRRQDALVTKVYDTHLHSADKCESSSLPTVPVHDLKPSQSLEIAMLYSLLGSLRNCHTLTTRRLL